MSAAFVLPPGDGRHIDMGNFSMTVKATAEDTIPAGEIHGFRVGERPGRKLDLYAPEAMVGYFDELAAAVREENLDDAYLGAIAERYGMEVLGPVPDRYV